MPTCFFYFLDLYALHPQDFSKKLFSLISFPLFPLVPLIKYFLVLYLSCILLFFLIKSGFFG